MKQLQLPTRSMGRWLMTLLLVMITSLAAKAAEAYACYTPSNTTLTFYYDNLRSSREGTTYDLNTGGDATGWETDGTNASVTRVVFNSSFANARPTSTSGWFFNMERLTSITGMKEYLNTSEVTHMDAMFCGCNKLTSLDVSGFNTANVTNMRNMFVDCKALTSLDVSNFNTAKVTNMLHMFSGCSSLMSLDLSSFNTANVTNMQDMFGYCSSLTSLDLSSFNTANVTDMYAMFYDCKALTSLDLSSFNTAKVTGMGVMFKYCSNLKTIYASSGWSTETVTRSADMFDECISLVGGQGTTYDADHVNKTYAHIDGGTSNPGYFTAGVEAYACYTPSNTTLTFYYDGQRATRSGTTYDLNEGSNYPAWYSDGTNANVTKVVFNSSFANARPTTTCRWFHDMTKLTSITGMKQYLNTSEVTDMNGMFTFCSSLTSLDLSGFNTANVTDMSGMFYYCNKLTSLDVSGFNTAKVTAMDGMFGYCTLTSLDLSGFNTANVTDMSSMFFSCGDLKTIYAGSGWSTGAVTNSNNMFYSCTSLVGGMGTTYNDSNPRDKTYAHIDGGTSNPGYFTAPTEAYACYTPGNTTLTFYYDGQRSSRSGTTHDLNNATIVPTWYRNNTYKSVTNVVFDPSFAGARPTCTVSWFDHMTNLISITGMEYLNTSAVTDMSAMFRGCTGLTSLDLRNFNTANVTDMGGLFDGCTGLTSLNLRNFNTAKVTALGVMFQGCSNLTTIYVSDQWSTAAVTVDYNMFYGCTSLVGGQGTTYSAVNVGKAYAHIDGGTANPGYLTEFKEAYACYTPSNTTLTFYYDNYRSSRSGTTYDLYSSTKLPGWYSDGTCANVTKVVFDPSFAGARQTVTFYWFYDMTKLTSITGMKEYLNTSAVTSMVGMFTNCSSLTSLDLSSFNTANVTTMYKLFYGCSGLTSLDLSSFNTANVTTMFRLFYGCSGLKTIYVGSGWSTAAVTNSNNMFNGCTSLVGGMGTTYNDSNPKDKTYAHIDGGTANPGYLTTPNPPVAYACYTPSNTTLTFYYDSQRSSREGTTYDLNEGSNVPGWLSNSNFANVTNVVFDSSFADARPTSTGGWFMYMTNLQTITGMSYLNTSQVSYMGGMFLYNRSLEHLDLSGFNTANVTDMSSMFYGCSGLESLDLSSFNTASVTDMSVMFADCTNLKTIYAGSGWSTDIVSRSSNMFYNCTSLVGGMGTTYDADHVEAAYAHIDGGTSNPGYLTDKNAGLRGDVNGDGSVSISDVTTLIDYLLGGDASIINQENANCNGDNTVSISDVTALIDFLLGGIW